MGIGTSSPSFKLTVVGNSYITNLTLGQVLGVSSGGTGTNTLASLTVGSNLNISGGESVLVGTSTQISLGPNVITGIATGTSGSVFNISTSTNSLTLNLPYASLVNTGQLQSADWLTFNNKLSGSGTANYLVKYTGASTTSSSIIFDNGTNVGIGTTSPSSVLFVQGNASYPTYNLFSVASSTGTQLLTVTPAGNVGIGTTSPQSTLDIQGTGSVNAPLMYGTTFAINTGNSVPASSGVTQNGGLRIAGGTGNVYVLDMGISNTNSYAWIQMNNNFNLAGTNAKDLSIQPLGGKVGIGVTNPTALLEISKPSTTDLLRIINNVDLFGTEAKITMRPYTTSDNLSAAISAKRASAANNVDLLFYASDGAGPSTEKMRIVGTNGNVGIGTTTPVAKLSLQGTAGAYDMLDIASSTGTSVLRITPSGNVGIGTSTPRAQLSVKSSSAATPALSLESATSPASDYLQVRSSGASAGDIFTIDSSGRVGIGTTAPATKLSIQGTAGANDLLNIASSSGTSVMYINSQGNVGIGTTTPATTLEVDKTAAGTPIAIFKDIGTSANGGSGVSFYNNYSNRLVP